MAKNILICDDAAFMRMMIKDILTKNGYNVVAEAENIQSLSLILYLWISQCLKWMEYRLLRK